MTADDDDERPPPYPDIDLDDEDDDGLDAGDTMREHDERGFVSAVIGGLRW